MKKILSLLAVLAALGAVLLVSASPGAAGTPRATAAKTKTTKKIPVPKKIPVLKVAVKDDFFAPKKVTIRKGSIIKWTWHGFNEHNVHVGGKKSGDKFKGTFQHRFLNKGRFKVLCTIHEDLGMEMTVTVK
jgi:plastocyanin